MERAKEVRNYRQKNFDELQDDIKGAKDMIKKYPPPKEKKKESPKSDTKGGIRGDIFDKSSFKKSF